jgi:hypothetical protein
MERDEQWMGLCKKSFKKSKKTFEICSFPNPLSKGAKGDHDV